MRSVALLFFGIHLAFADNFTYPFCITCEDETGNVEEEFTLTCRVSDQKHICCKKNNKFSQIASNDSSTICKGEFSTDPCVKMTNFSCFYTANSAMPITFLLFMETECESIRGIFTDDDWHLGNSINHEHEEDHEEDLIRHCVFFVLLAAGCVLPLIVFAVIMGAIVWMKSSQVKRLLKGYMLGKTTDADSVSDQEMQKYSSCNSMVVPGNF